MDLNPDYIFEKIRYIISIENDGTVLLKNPDMFVPFFSILIFILSLSKKSHSHLVLFYFVIVLGSLYIFLVINLMKKTNISLTFYKTFSILLYCFLPISIFSFYSLFFLINSFLGLLMSLSTLFYSAYKSSNVFQQYLLMREQSHLLTYMLGIYYAFYIFLIM